MLQLIVDNSLAVRDATFDRETRMHLGEAADALRTLAAIVETARDIEKPESSMSYTALGYAVSKHLAERDPWEVRELAVSTDVVCERWDADGQTPLRPAPAGATA